jgi:phage/plasmid-associated DNA primase
VEDVKNMYRRLSDPVYAFLQDSCEPCEDDFIVKADLFKKFQNYVVANRLPSITMKKFIGSVEEQSYIPVEPFRPQTESGQKKAWLGVKQRTPQQAAGHVRAVCNQSKSSRFICL